MPPLAPQNPGLRRCGRMLWKKDDTLQSISRLTVASEFTLDSLPRDKVKPTRVFKGRLLRHTDIYDNPQSILRKYIMTSSTRNRI